MSSEAAQSGQFCTRCGAPLRGGAGFCSQCGAPAGTPSAPPAAAISQSLPVPPRSKSHTALYVVLAVVVIIILIVAVAEYHPAPSSSVKATTQNLVDTSGQTPGSSTNFVTGDQNASVVNFTIPTGASDAHLSGWMNASCRGGGNCPDLVYVSTWSNLSHGLDGAYAYVVWCTEVDGTCVPLTDSQISTGDISEFDGQVLCLVFEFTAGSAQTYSADVDLVYTT